MRRRKALALLGSTGIAAIAGCSGGNNENSGQDDGTATNGGTDGSTGGTSGSCVPPTDNLASLLPSGSDQFEKGREASTGLEIGTDSYVVGRYETQDGAVVDLLIAEYGSTDAAEGAVTTVRSSSENAVMGTLVDGNYVVAVDAPSQNVGRSLVRESEISCANQFNFSGGGNTGETESESFDVGDVIWSQRGANAARTRAVTTEGLTTSDPSQYTIEIGEVRPPLVAGNAIINNGQIHQISDGAVVGELPAQSAVSPAYSDGVVVVATESDGRIRGIDLQSREEQWDYLPRSFPLSLAAADGVAFAVTDSQSVAALDISTGEELWTTEGEEIRGYTSGLLFVRDSLSELAVDVSDGSVAYEVGEDIQQVGNGGVYVGGSTTTKRLNAEDGSTDWQNAPLNGELEPLAVDDEYAYMSTDTRGRLTALRIDSGEEAWTSMRDSGFRSIAVTGNRVYLATGNRVFTLNKEGEELGRYAVQFIEQLLAGEQVLIAVDSSEATVLR